MIDVLIGTQIVAKGHHFPQLTLAGMIDADLGGVAGDPRAAERSFQLLHQVAGRSGRGGKPGLVLIQTRNPDDPVMRALAEQPRDDFLSGNPRPRKRTLRRPSGGWPRSSLPATTAHGARTGRALALSAPKTRGLTCGDRRRPSTRSCADARASGFSCRRKRASTSRLICARGWSR